MNIKKIGLWFHRAMSAGAFIAGFLVLLELKRKRGEK